MQSAQKPPPYGSVEYPVVVFRDNPAFLGEFSSVAGESWSATGEYGHDGRWEGGLDGFLLTVGLAVNGTVDAEQAPLLPLPGQGMFPEIARCKTRTQRLYHGRVFSAEREITGPNPLAPDRTIHVELSPSTGTFPSSKSSARSS